MQLPDHDRLRTRDYNSRAWDAEVERGNPWTVPVTPEKVEAARRGAWEVVLTPTVPVPREWFPPLAGAEMLCLASGGGQQAPLFAAAGARVTVLDMSRRQLGREREVARRDGLAIATLRGDMADLSMFRDETFDVIFHPVSNCFVPDVRPVWREAARVLRPGAPLLAGFSNGFGYTMDMKLLDEGKLKMVHALPYSDHESLTGEEREEYLRRREPLEFGHTLEDQIGGQLEAGLLLTHMFEDRSPDDALAELVSTFMATRAVKPADGRRP